ncbi:MAG: HPt (histidine-containing phosphotransfer) domain-containing protein [Flavobacteriales bacterium]|jgi:HPt (histidine-containing phosphotransfer) domain-containing protein
MQQWLLVEPANAVTFIPEKQNYYTHNHAIEPHTTEPHTTEQQNHIPSDEWDLNDFLERFDNNHDRAKRLIGIFMKNLPSMLEELHCAHSAKDYPLLDIQLHTLLGASHNINASKLGDLCAQIQYRCKQLISQNPSSDADNSVNICKINALVQALDAASKTLKICVEQWLNQKRP